MSLYSTQYVIHCDLQELLKAVRKMRQKRSLRISHIHLDNTPPDTCLTTSCTRQIMLTSGSPIYSTTHIWDLFGPMEDNFRGQRFYNTYKLKLAVEKWAQRFYNTYEMKLIMEKWVQRQTIVFQRESFFKVK